MVSQNFVVTVGILSFLMTRLVLEIVV